MIMKRDNLKKNLIFQGVGGVIARIGSLIFTIILARLLIPSSFGAYNLALTIIISLTAVIDLGLGTTIVKFVTSTKTKKLARSRFLFLFKFKFIWALIISISVLLLSKTISTFYNVPLLEIPLKIGAIYLFLNSMYTILGSIFLALEKLRYTAYMEFIFQTIRVVLVILLFRIDSEIGIIFSFLAISVGIAILFGIWTIITQFQFLFKGPTQLIERRKMLKYSGFIALSTLGVVLFSNIDKLYLGHFVDITYIGYYAVIISLLGGALGTFSMMGVFFPRFIATKEKNLEENFRKTVNYATILSIPATMGFAYLSLPLIKILYGSNYVPKEQYFQLFLTSAILGCLIFEGVVNGLFKTLLNSRSYVKTTALGMGFSTILNLILNPLLIVYFLNFGESYALLGVAIATVISRYLDFGFMIWAVKSKLKISIKLGSFIKPILSSVLMIFFLKAFKPYFNSVSLFILIALGAIFYLIIMILLNGFNYGEFKKYINQQD